MNEAILITDPWITTSSAILQRFGTPALYNAQGSSMVRHHTFGLDPATGVVFSGVHNVHLESTSNSNETESITLFVNTVTGSDYSAVSLPPAKLSKTIQWEISLYFYFLLQECLHVVKKK